jgi:uncharacterized delta-60 repeat protein
MALFSLLSPAHPHLSRSDSKRGRAGRRRRERRRAILASAVPVFELTPLEQRVYLSFAPSISGPATALGGQPYVLNLSYTGTVTPASWSINWGDNSDPDGNGTVGEQFSGNPSTRSHTYVNTAANYTITATAKTPSNQTVSAQPLGLDTSFGSTGNVLTDFTTGIDGGYATAIDANGKIVVAGIYNNGDFALARYTSSGAQDTDLTSGFGPVNQAGTARAGWVKVDFSGNNTSTDKAYAVAIQSDGKILVAGTSNVNGSPAGYDFVVARFNTDGTLDTNFGNSSHTGYATIDFGTSNNPSTDQANAIVIDSQGRILVAGTSSAHQNAFACARLTSSGSLDTSFNSTGKQLITFPNSIQPTFSCQAIVLEPYTYTSNGNTVTTQRIVLGGYAMASGQSQTTDFALTRLNDNGSIDNGASPDPNTSDWFGTSSSKGYVLTDFTATGSCCSAGSSDSDFTLVLMNDTRMTPATPKLVAAGSANPNGLSLDFAAARYTLDGQLDTDATYGFGTSHSGKVTVDFNGGDDIAYASAVQSADGKLILAGSATSSGSYSTGTDFGVLRLNANGTLDSTFGNGGKLTTDFGASGSGAATSTDVARSMSLLSDGRILVAGYAQTGSNQQFALARYQPNNQVTVYAMPAPPTNFLVTGARAGRVDLSWSASGGATGYVVERSSNQTSWQGFEVTGPQTVTYSDPTPADGCTYYYRVRAENSHGTGLPSDVARVQIAVAHTTISADGFEAPAIASGTSQTAPAGSIWTIVQQPSNQGAAGIANHSPTLYTTQAGEAPPDGSQDAFIQGDGFISQFANLAPGEYEVRFSAGQVAANASSEAVQVLVDGVVKATISAGAGFDSYLADFDVATTGGSDLHSIQLLGVDSGTGSDGVLVDHVTIVPAAPTNLTATAVTAAEIDLSDDVPPVVEG